MRELKMNQVIKRYNLVMNDNACEHLTINTKLSENTDNWNIRDMVAEVEYLLRTFLNPGYSNAELKDTDYTKWYREVTRMKRFIRSYEPYISDYSVTVRHCSKFDN